MTLSKDVKPVTKWSYWWVGMFAFLAVRLLVYAFTVDFYHWLTLAALEFGIPETIGAWKQNDRFPPLTHIIVRYVPMEIAMPLLYGFAGSIGAYWIGFAHPEWIGGIVGIVGWLDAHFLSRFLKKG
jgi:hypothetical protein